MNPEEELSPAARLAKCDEELSKIRRAGPEGFAEAMGRAMAEAIEGLPDDEAQALLNISKIAAYSITEGSLTALRERLAAEARDAEGDRV